MGTPTDQDTGSPLVLLVVEQLGPARLGALLASEEGRWLASRLTACSRRRMDLFYMTGRNGVAATLATGVIPQRHGLVGTHEPDANSMEIRAIDGRSWQHVPFWSLLGSEGRSCCTIGWPATEPAGVLTSGKNAQSAVIAPHSFAPREDPHEAWLLPPRTVSPEELRPLVRSCRVHPADVPENEQGIVTLKSISSIARALLDRDRPDLLACWLAPNAPDANQDDTFLLGAVNQGIRSIVEAAGTCSLALLCLPGLQEGQSPQGDSMQGQLFFDSRALGTRSIPPVVQDVDLAPLVLRMCGSKCEPMVREQPDQVQVAKVADQRAHDLVESGRRSRRTPGRQRTYTRMVGQRSGVIGADLLARRDFGQARLWLEDGVRTSGWAPFVGMLIHALLGAGDADRLDRLANSAAIPSFMRTIAASASAILRGEYETAIQALGDDPPVNHGQALLRAEMLLRAGDAVAASDLLKTFQVTFVRTGNVRALRLSYIAARRAGRGPLVADLARALVMFRPLEIRRRRFVMRD